LVLAQAPPAQPTTVASAPLSAEAFDLAACRRLALARQPALAAAQDTLAAAQARARAVEELHVPTLLQPDLPIRRHQSALGVGIAQAGVNQAEAEAVYAVTRNYFSVLFAREQKAVALQALDNLKGLQESLTDIVNSGARTDVTRRHIEKVNVYIDIVKGRLPEAEEGVNRATAALREAMGGGPDCPVQVADSRLPDLDFEVNRDQLVALALERRGEMIQANLAAEVVSCEVSAQGTSRRPTKRTFASASDIHAQQVPQGVRNEEYRPGALPLEMPVSLVGSKAARQEQASALAARAGAVVEKTRNLITLEVDDNYLKWREARAKLVELRRAQKNAQSYFDHIKEDFGGTNARTPPDDVLNAGILLTQIRVQANDAHYHYLLGLAALERVTAGGFCPGFDAVAAPQP
jgi:outer membrane protein TolC